MPQLADAEPSRQRRLVIAGLVGTAAIAIALYSWWRMHGLSAGGGGDFDQVWFAAKALRSGENPYPLIGPGKEFEWPWPLLYPGTTVAAVVPFSFLPLLLARVLFIGLGATLFTYAITRDGFARLPVLLGLSFLNALVYCQWTPLLTAAMLIPSLAWLLPLKPNVGLGLALAASPGIVWRNLVVGLAVLLVVSLVLVPEWPVEWWKAIQQAPHMHIPLITIGGPLMLLALLRWRRSDAQLLLLYACLPHTPIIYDVLPLAWIPRTRREAMVFALLTHLAVVAQVYLLPRNAGDGGLWAARILNVTIYLPCLVMILRRPNVDEPTTLGNLIAHALQRWKNRVPDSAASTP